MFFGGSSNKALGPIGIAVTRREVRLAQLCADGAAFASHAMPEQVDPADSSFHAATANAVVHACKGTRFSGRLAVSAMPVQSLRYKTLRLPPMPEEDLSQAIAWEAAERLGVTGQDILQYYAAGRVHQGGDEREEFIVLAADGAAVNDHAYAIQRAGFEPAAIDATAGALARLLGTEGQSTLIVDLSEQTAEVVVAQGQSVVFDKLIDLVRSPEGELDADAFARELALCLRYTSVTFRIHRPDAGWLVAKPAEAAMAEQLGDATHTPILPATRSPVLSGIQLPGADPTAWLVALGLSMRDLTGRAQRGAA